MHHNFVTYDAWQLLNWLASSVVSHRPMEAWPAFPFLKEVAAKMAVRMASRSMAHEQGKDAG
jgi:hypothetical protein